MRKLIVLTLMAAGVFSLSGCGSKEVKNAANDAVEIFASGDIEEINRLVFGTQTMEEDAEVRSILGETNEDSQQDGVLSTVFSESTISVGKADKETIKFEIVAPDMERVFTDLSLDNTEISEEELLKYIEEYMEEAEKKGFVVDVPYIINDDGQVVIDYRDETFLNAVSGGLIEAYKELYMEVLQEYRGEK